MLCPKNDFEEIKTKPAHEQSSSLRGVSQYSRTPTMKKLEGLWTLLWTRETKTVATKKFHEKLRNSLTNVPSDTETEPEVEERSRRRSRKVQQRSGNKNFGLIFKEPKLL